MIVAKRLTATKDLNSGIWVRIYRARMYGARLFAVSVFGAVYSLTLISGAQANDTRRARLIECKAAGAGLMPIEGAVGCFNLGGRVYVQAGASRHSSFNDPFNDAPARYIQNSGSVAPIQAGARVRAAPLPTGVITR